ncbi:MAG: hypothetical protein U9N72_02880 [Bacteroidota bacterium]|nr:hypothetical protein [Bacteroidota bacterium]
MKKLLIIIVTCVLVSLVYSGCKTENNKTQESVASEADITFILKDWCKSFVVKMSDPTPLSADFHRSVTGNMMNDLMFFIQRFFNTSPYDKLELTKEHSRIVHGGHAIPIFYRTSDEIGVRSAWYQVNKGQQVNEPGDTNPFPQYFIVIRGNGFALIGNDTVRIKENEAYYIEPGSNHVFWTESEDPMEMIFLAWERG